MAKILILIGAHLCTAPRPQKEAETLANAGHDVTVGGFWFDPELVKRDRLLLTNKKYKFQPIVDFQPHNRLINLGIRLQGRFAKEIFQRWGIFSPGLLGYSPTAMLSFAKKRSPDLTIVHSEAGLWVGNQLLDKGYQVGVDIEDWFSEDLLPNARATRPIEKIKNLEAHLLRKSTYSITTSSCLAKALAKAYQAPEPTVIYNAFPWSERKRIIDNQKLDRQNFTDISQMRSIHWFSQTIGPGRGLENLFQALPFLKTPVEIHLRGNYPATSRQWLEPLIPDNWRERLYIHTTVPNAELLSRIAEHDIGLALEVPYCLNKEYTVSNKLFQYLQAGLAVIATDTLGQKEILSQYPEIGSLIPSQNPQALAIAIEDLITNPQKLTQAKTAALDTAQNYLCWEKQTEKLRSLIESSLESKA
ncbi:MAG: glycosyltransferase [Mastigocoleus sp.]